MYSPMQTFPSSFDICCFVFAKMNIRILLINKIPQSIIDSFSTFSGERMAENPRINKMSVSYTHLDVYKRQELDEGTTVSIKIPAIIYSEENRKKFESSSQKDKQEET